MTKPLVGMLAIATLNAVALSADREIKVDDRLDAPSEALTAWWSYRV